MKISGYFDVVLSKLKIKWLLGMCIISWSSNLFFNLSIGFKVLDTHSYAFLEL